VTHGFVLDGKGQKMSKSLGNVITPEEIMKTLGADILRLWVASVDYSEDVRISKDILERNADAYRKIRNTLRFLLGAIADFDPKRDNLPEGDWTGLDRWVWSAFLNLAAEVREAYLGYNFLAASQALLSFCQLELSGRYFEIIKDRLYCDATDSRRRRSCRTVCRRLAEGLAVLMAPLLSFTADEVWENIPASEGHVFEQRFPEGQGLVATSGWNRFWEIREAVQAAMEPHRAAKSIGTSLDARVRLVIKGEDLLTIRSQNLGESLTDLLVVSSVDVAEGDELEISVEPHSGTKCPRCWNRLGGAGQGEDVDLCPRCWTVVAAEAE
jgi:isoleucyl-tRNA synthetase